MKILLQGRPDYGKESPEYTAGIADALSWLTDQELAWLTDPRDGLHTVCQYLPTPADVHNFLKTKRAKEDQFKSRAPWKPFAPEPYIPPLSPESRTRMQKLVDDLRRDWVEPGRANGFTYRPADEIKSSSDLKSPDGPISDELRQQLIDSGWTHFANQSPDRSAA